MTISVYNLKGGVGKTTLSYIISKEFNYRFITNDISNVLNKYKNSSFIMGQHKLCNDTVYDFGGFKDKTAEEICNLSDKVLIPTINDENSIYKTIETIKLIKNKDKIIIVATQLENEIDFEVIKKEILNFFPNMKIIKLNKTKLFRNALIAGKKVTDLINESRIK